ncbi:MAG: acyl--CoA ligase [Solirubrobacterales bacterium]|nr:acyl--CoA ligase [Solirubrobacterales bacterium]
MNFCRDLVDAAPPEALALIELTRAGERREWTFGALADGSARLAGHLAAAGAGPGDRVLVMIGNRVEWVLTMLACFRIGAVPAACPEQLRAKDLRLRLEIAAPVLAVADERNRAELTAAEPACPILWTPDDRLWRSGERAAPVELAETDPCLVMYTSGTTGAAKGVLHVQRWLAGQRLQAEHWVGARAGETFWCSASTGWSKSTRNVFIAPWLRGATAILHDGRFDPAERLEILARERVATLCMAPTEYRVIAKRTRIPALESLRGCVAAGEALDPGAIEAWRAATGVEVRDGYGQTETGHLTGYAPGERVRPGSMGRPLPGVDLRIADGEIVVDPATVPTFFHGYVGEPPAATDRPWHTGDRAEADEDGYLWFGGRNDDIIVSAGYRIGPFEVESALGSHPAVVEAAAVAAPDDERGSIVRAFVVLADGYAGSGDLARALQDHVKAETAPYKYPRRIDFVAELPKTASGKIRRAALRDRA